MTVKTLCCTSSENPLPSAPETSQVLAATTARLDAIRTTALPAVRQYRTYVVRVWYSQNADADLIHIRPGLAIPCHPAGADRLATAVADEAALVREETALCELKRALEDYEAGGRELKEELEEIADVMNVPAEFRVVPPPCVAADAGSVAERQFARWLASYASSVEQELSDAIESQDYERERILRAELDELRGRLDEDANRRAPTKVASRPAVRGHRDRPNRGMRRIA